MMRSLTLYLAAALLFFPLDMLWLGVIAREFYKAQLGDLLAPQPNWLVAIAFYLLYLAGLVFFVMAPAAARGDSLWQTALHGALFGLIAYATYDLTNLATLRSYPSTLALVDMAWGAVLTAAAAAGGLALARLVTDLR
jgi:uncharacterized membrane protein